MGEERKYTTIALDKKTTYMKLLNVQHEMENKIGNRLSFSDVISFLCEKYDKKENNE